MLKKIMKEKKISIRKLSEIAGVSPMTIQKMLKDPLAVNGEMLKSVAKALNLEVSVIFKSLSG